MHVGLSIGSKYLEASPRSHVHVLVNGSPGMIALLVLAGVGWYDVLVRFNGFEICSSKAASSVFPVTPSKIYARRRYAVFEYSGVWKGRPTGVTPDNILKNSVDFQYIVLLWWCRYGAYLFLSKAAAMDLLRTSESQMC